MYSLFNLENIITGDNMENNKQKIKCDVYSCRYCNCDDKSCMKEEIQVCNCLNDTKKEATMCSSYKKDR